MRGAFAGRGWVRVVATDPTPAIDLDAGWADPQRHFNSGRRSDLRRIVAEVNRGGDLVAATIRQTDPNIPIREVRASKGKDLRAEPVSALYEQGRIFHVGNYDALEHQMVTWDPTSQESMREKKQATSPDRLDALVWGLSSLALSRGGSKFVPLTTPILPTTDF